MVARVVRSACRPAGRSGPVSGLSFDVARREPHADLSRRAVVADRLFASERIGNFRTDPVPPHRSLTARIAVHMVGAAPPEFRKVSTPHRRGLAQRRSVWIRTGCPDGPSSPSRWRHLSAQVRWPPADGRTGSGRQRRGQHLVPLHPAAGGHPQGRGRCVQRRQPGWQAGRDVASRTTRSRPRSARRSVPTRRPRSSGPGAAAVCGTTCEQRPGRGSDRLVRAEPAGQGQALRHHLRRGDGRRPDLRRAVRERLADRPLLQQDPVHTGRRPATDHVETS